MRIVAALGGNALLERGESPDASIQEAHVTSAVTALTPVLRHNQLLSTHGNGPQVGVLAMESAGDRALSHPDPFDVLGAQWSVPAFLDTELGCQLTEFLIP